jgi:hypothetical protein
MTAANTRPDPAQGSAPDAAPQELAGGTPKDLARDQARIVTWLEDAGVPTRVIDELMGHAAGRRDGAAHSRGGEPHRHPLSLDDPGHGGPRGGRD